MRAKTIKTVLRKKLDNWVSTIKDEQVQKLVQRNTIITGGSIVSLLMNEKPKDFDLYFRNKETVKAVAEYYADQWNRLHPAGVANGLGALKRVFVLDGADVEAWKAGEKKLPDFCPNYEKDYPWKDIKDGRYFEDVNDQGEPVQLRVSHMITNTPKDRIKIIYPSSGVVGELPTKSEMIDSLDELSEIMEEEVTTTEDKDKYRPLFLTTNAITLANGIQLIIRFYGEPDEIHATYDFEHCCCHWDAYSGELSTPERSLMCIMNKELFYRGSKYPLCSVLRSRKFVKRGWNINAGQYLKMCFQVSELDLHDVDVLEDQLVGVDTIYFLQIVSALRKMKEQDSTFSFDSTYLSTIVDRIF